MSKWDKLIERILEKDRSLRFDELARALIKIGYAEHQPKGGSSHYTFRKNGCTPITIPKKKSPIDKVYITLVRDAVKQYLNEEEI
ncbi:MAG: toxin HicA [Oscillospiraceae bacterium]|nr:toxin HicA [Oscillospiraceae bacterium]MBQ6697538.1 toxin HicA [Oscillospiraceae bacterium]MBQ7055112.1 toxin HicA [Oscillospiraceae bacterium]